MKRKLYAALLTVGLGVPVFGVQSVPITSSDKQMIDSKFGGTSTCFISNSTGTTPLLCTTGSGIILDIVGSSIPATDTFILRDSSFAATTSTPTYIVDKNSLDKANRVFPRFKSGLQVQLLVAPNASSQSTSTYPAWTVIYNKDLY